MVKTTACAALALTMIWAGCGTTVEPSMDAALT